MKDTEEREPLLSDEALGKMGNTGNGMVSYETGLMMMRVRDFYEAKITSGELRVVKDVEDNGSASVFACSSCAFLVDGQGDMPSFKYCPGCGNPINR